MEDEVDDFLIHYGVKGMKWGKRRRAQAKADRGARKEARREVLSNANSYIKANKKRNIGTTVATGILLGPTAALSSHSAQIARSAGYSKGKSLAIGILGGPIGAAVAVEVTARKIARANG